MSAGIDSLNSIVYRFIQSPETVVRYAGIGAYEQVKMGIQVYNRPSMAALVTFVCLGLSFLIDSSSIDFLVRSMLFMLFYVDVYEYVMNMVYENQTFLEVQIIGQVCLQHQWHHMIPYAVLVRPFWVVCGDLNGIMALHVASWFVTTLFLSPSTNTLAGCKIFLVYLSQWRNRREQERFQNTWGLRSLDLNIDTPEDFSFDLEFYSLMTHRVKGVRTTGPRWIVFIAGTLMTLFDVVFFGWLLGD